MLLPFGEWYAHLEKSCATLERLHDDDPARLYADLSAAGITPKLVRGKIDFDGVEHVHLTPKAWQRVFANWKGLIALLENQAMNTAQLSLPMVTNTSIPYGSKN